MPAAGAWAVIAGGGTAGHAVPALAIGRALVARGHEPASIHFVGSRRGVESVLLDGTGFSLTLLPGRGIARRLTVANVGAAAGLAWAVPKALALLGRLRPAVVVSVGGYAALPTALAAVALRVPLVVAEQNAVPGAANRVVGRFARAAAVSFPGTALPRAVVTGNPVRAEILEADASPGGRRAARAELGLPESRRVVLVAGGSLGSRRINHAVVDAARRWRDGAGRAVYHVVGRRDWPELAPLLPQSDGGLLYQAVEYEHRMHLAYAAADVAVCRAGGSTVAELGVVGVPAVLVPLPGAPGDHQTENARAMARVGGAVVVADADFTGDRLVAEVDALLGDTERLDAMAAAARSAGRRDAAERVAALVEEHARRLGGRRLGGRPK